jgi:uncharacterized protein YbaA (DUF1428 family)
MITTTTYIDAFVLLVPKKNRTKYKKMANDAAKVWMKHGALSYKECRGDDLNPDMKGSPFLPFPKLTKVKPTEDIWFSYIEYKSKTHRNSVNKKVMKEMEKEYKDKPMPPMPFDMKKMAFGGFKVEVNG